MTNRKDDLSKQAFRFVIIIGIANFFADFTYEGARGIIGPFLGSLGASATIIGTVSGLGEFVGYALRSVTGYFADHTRRYWAFAFVGYLINMLAVPALALAGNWPVAAALIVAERTGRAIRRPSVETMLSFTAHRLGRGWVFGLNEALDQAGATLGPLIVALVLYLKGDFRNGFAILLIPALCCLITILVAWVLYKHPHKFEKEEETAAISTFRKKYWLYLIGGALVAAGFADFSLISFHLERNHVFTNQTIPVLYSLAMATAAIASLVFGRLLDKLGFGIFLVAFFLSAFFAPFAFTYSVILAIIGTILWGIGVGAQDSLLKAELIKFISIHKRSTGFGIFDTGFGMGWFAGSVALGWLYDHSILFVILFSVLFQLASIPLFIAANKSR